LYKYVTSNTKVVPSAASFAYNVLFVSVLWGKVPDKSLNWEKLEFELGKVPIAPKSTQVSQAASLFTLQTWPHFDGKRKWKGMREET
jgi:hypothetical protein